MAKCLPRYCLRRRGGLRAIVMPNRKPPVTTTGQALAYRERILAALPESMSFEPLMALHLTEGTEPSEIATAKASGAVHAVKYYPANATTNAEFGVTDIKRCYPVFAAMEQHDLPRLSTARSDRLLAE